MAQKFSMGFFGFVAGPRDFLGVLIFAPIRSSLSLEIWSTPPPHPLKFCRHSNRKISVLSTSITLKLAF